MKNLLRDMKIGEDQDDELLIDLRSDDGNEEQMPTDVLQIRILYPLFPYNFLCLRFSPRLSSQKSSSCRLLLNMGELRAPKNKTPKKDFIFHVNFQIMCQVRKNCFYTEPF